MNFLGKSKKELLAICLVFIGLPALLLSFAFAIEQEQKLEVNTEPEQESRIPVGVPLASDDQEAETAILEIPGDGGAATAPGGGHKTNYYVTPQFETDDQGNDKTHIYIGGLKVATIINSPTANPQIQYILSDHLGSPTVITDESGQVKELRDYEPYGRANVRETISDPDNDYFFTGKELDLESDLQYFEQRYYDQSTGRFISQDPALQYLHDYRLLQAETDHDLEFFLQNPQLLNQYSYTANNPVRYTDPDGELLDTFIDVGFIGYDLYRIGKQFATTGHVSNTEWKALGADVGGAFVPFVSGGGLLVRGVNKVDDVVDAGRAANVARRFAVSQSEINSILRNADNAYEVAIKGGTNSGMLKTFSKMTTEQLEKSYRSYGAQVEKHINKIQNPSKWIRDFDTKDIRELSGIIGKWEKDLFRNRQLQNIVKEVLDQK